MLVLDPRWNFGLALEGEAEGLTCRQITVRFWGPNGSQGNCGRTAGCRAASGGGGAQGRSSGNIATRPGRNPANAWARASVRPGTSLGGVGSFGRLSSSAWFPYSADLARWSVGHGGMPAEVVLVLRRPWQRRRFGPVSHGAGTDVGGLSGSAAKRIVVEMGIFSAIGARAAWFSSTRYRKRGRRHPVRPAVVPLRGMKRQGSDRDAGCKAPFPEEGPGQTSSRLPSEYRTLTVTVPSLRSQGRTV